MINAIVNVNGEIMEADQAKTSVFDRGFLYGDSLYEVARTYHGRFLFLEDHLKRLEASAALCRIVLGQSIQLYQDEMYRTLEAWRSRKGQEKAEVYARIIVTRGIGRIGFGLNCLESTTQYFIIVQAVEPPTPAQYKKGYHLRVAERLRNHPRALDPAMKSGNYLNSLLAYLEATAMDFDDALLCNGDGHLTEGTTFNIFYVRRGIIATPPLDIGILDGITRRKVIQAGRSEGFDVREVRFSKTRLLEADEVFMSSSIKEVFPVTRIDGELIGGGKPGPVTLKLHSAYQKLIQEYARGGKP